MVLLIITLTKLNPDDEDDEDKESRRKVVFFSSTIIGGKFLWPISSGINPILSAMLKVLTFILAALALASPIQATVYDFEELGK